MAKKFISASFLFALICGSSVMIAAQQNEAQKTQIRQESTKPGSIKGRVVGDDGEPLTDVQVFAAVIGRSGERRMQGGGAPTQAITDEEGNFEITDLPPASYLISASVPGYIAPPPDEESGLGIYHIGDFANITLIKGGVITGKVMNANGEPLTGVSISAVRIADINGETESQPLPQGFGRNWRTDDLGVYRIYGLVPGTYIVQAGSINRNRPGGNSLSPYWEDAPTYYPSSARDAAMPLIVNAGAEIAGIDIRYRSEKGRAVSGQVFAKSTGNDNFGATAIFLSLPGTDSIVATTSQIARGIGRVGGRIAGRNEASGFAFYGISDGDYEISARRIGLGENESDSVAMPRSVSVRGSDVSGIQLSLTPLALLSGRLVLEKSQIACPTERRSSIQEILLTAERDETSPQKESALSRLNPIRPAAPAATGEFAFRNLDSGRWRMVAKLPDEFWFIRSINFPGKTSTTPARRTASATAAAAPLTDAGRNGIAVRSGEKLAGMTIVISEGAAGLKGKVVAGESEAPSGAIRVYLIPAEKEAADNVLRFSQTDAAGDGGFQFKNLAPGRYYLLAKPIKSGAVTRPVAWDQIGRTALRKEAEAAGKIIELQPCQRISDYKLNF